MQAMTKLWIAGAMLAAAPAAAFAQDANDPAAAAAKEQVAAMYSMDNVKPDKPFGELPLDLTIAPDTVTTALLQWGEPDIAELRGRCDVIEANATAFPEAAIDICQLAIPDTESEQEQADPN